MRKFGILLFISVLHLCSQAQEVDSAYLIYEDQFQILMASRGYAGKDINELLYSYRTNHINSNEDFAQFLGSTYPSDQGIAVLQYFYKNDTLREVLFEPGRVQEVRRIPLTKSRLTQICTNLNKALHLYQLSFNRAPVPRGATVEPDTTVPKQSYSEIVKELTDILLPKSFTANYRHLIVIPCLNIGSLPFQLLQPYGDSSTLIDKCSVTVATTLVDFVYLRAKVLKNYHYDGSLELATKTDNSRFAQLRADFSWESEHPVFICNPAYPTHTNYVFPNLPDAEKEIANAIPFAKDYTILKGAEATKANVLKALCNSDIGYFATHGVADLADPMTKSFLVLTGSDPFLTSKEIQDLRLNADYQAPPLIILSACQTGLGKPLEAGIAGSLARSFILSGSTFVVQSLWSVDDAATAYLMNRFFMHLPEKLPFFPAGAMRQAIIDTKAKFPNPVYWASFTVAGIDY